MLDVSLNRPLMVEVNREDLNYMYTPLANGRPNNFITPHSTPIPQFDSQLVCCVHVCTRRYNNVSLNYVL